MNKSYLLNAFSVQMLQDFPCNVVFTEVGELPKDLESAIGHQDTANVLGVEMNRVSVSLKKGDTAYIAQLVGGDCRKGAPLPEGYRLRLFKVEIS